MDCNILLLGQTGVGKSSLLNYIAGKEIAAAGIASGVGGLTRGINKYPVEINGQKCIISDSEGLELGHSDFWERLIEKALFKTNIKKDIGKWYHIVVYCIGANGGRVQDFELSIIDKIIEAKYGLIIAFTKSDLATDDELDSMKEAIVDHVENLNLLSFVNICSRKTRSSIPEGKEELCECIIDSWGESLLNRLPGHVYDPVFPALDKWYASVFDWLSNQKIGFFNWSKEDLLEELNQKFKQKQDNLNSGIKRRQTRAFNGISNVYGTLSEVLDISSISSLSNSVIPRIEKLEKAFVFDSATGGISKAAGLIAIGAMAIPVVAVPLAIGGAIMYIIDKNKRSKEVVDAFNFQFCKLKKLYCERKMFLEYSIAAEIGYIYGVCEVAICYLKGRGVEKNFDMFCECISQLAGYLDEYQDRYEDGRSEYYIAYMYYALNDTSEAKKWINRSYKHGYEHARKAYKFRDKYKEMQVIEESDDTEYFESWFQCKHSVKDVQSF